MVKHLDCPAEELEVHIVSGLETQMLTWEGHALREGGLVGAFITRVRVFPAAGAAASELWLTVAIWPVHAFRGKSEICISVKSAIFKNIVN